MLKIALVLVKIYVLVGKKGISEFLHQVAPKDTAYNESYYGECVRHLNVRIGKHIGISPLTRKKVKPKCSAFSDHLLLCNHSPSFENFSVLTK